MTVLKTHIASDENLERCATALEIIAGVDVGMRYDPDAGEYSGIGRWLASRRDGKKYTVRVPLTASTACTKLDANAGIAVPTPGTNARPAVDPYATLNPFFHVDVTGYPDADGRPHVKTIEWDGLFRRDGTAGNVLFMAPVLWWSYVVEDGGQSALLSVSDSPLPGMVPQPEAVLPDGTLRECMLYPKYVMSTYDGKPASVSGAQPRTRDVSHNSLITQVIQANGENESWTGKTLALDWYLKVMFLLKYATRNSQSVFQGCVSYDVKRQPYAATDATDHIDLAKGHGLLLGSAVMVGSEDVDRGNATAHDVVDYAVIKSIDASDEGFDRLMLDRDVTVATTDWVKTAPWPTGACDGVYGDGSPYDPLSGDEPFALQGIEVGIGAYEVFGNVVLHNDGSTGWRVYVNHDAIAETASFSASVHDDTGIALPSGDTTTWSYPLNMVDAGGLLCGSNSGGSTTSGMCDGHYTNPTTQAGDRELHSLGDLVHGSTAGLWYLYGDNALSVAWWNIASRLSATGRSRGEAA